MLGKWQFLTSLKRSRISCWFSLLSLRCCFWSHLYSLNLSLIADASPESSHAWNKHRQNISWDLKFLRRWEVRCWFSGFICHVALEVLTNVSEESYGSIFRVTSTLIIITRRNKPRWLTSHNYRYLKTCHWRWKTWFVTSRINIVWRMVDGSWLRLWERNPWFTFLF